MAANIPKRAATIPPVAMMWGVTSKWTRNPCESFWRLMVDQNNHAPPMPTKAPTMESPKLSARMKAKSS